MASSHGRFVWYELTATDPAASTSFYRTVMGWGEKDAGLPDLSYTLLSAGSVPVAGITATTPGVGAGWTGYVGVRDVDAAVATAVDLGGAVHEAPTDVPGIGRYAVLADPQGARLALFKPFDSEVAAPPPGLHGSGGWHELHTTDWAEAWPFYEALFGWTLREADDLGPTGQYQTFATGTAAESRGGMMTDRKGSPRWLYYFHVDGIDDAIARVRQADGMVIAGPHEAPEGVFIAHCVDPSGTAFALGSPARTAASAAA